MTSTPNTYGPARWLDRLLSLMFWWTALAGVVVILLVVTAMFNAGFSLANGVQLAIAVALLAAFLRIVGELRDFIASIARGDAFNKVNPPRLRQIGWMVVLIDVVAHAGLLIPKGAPGAVGVTFKAPSPGDELLGLIVILVIFTLAEAFRQGAKLHNDAKLTV